MIETVVFLSGAVVMILELVASRVLAPYLGTSLFVWTSLIGMILGSLSLGYYFGGRLADSRPYPRTLSAVLLAAAASIALIPLIQAPILSFLSASISDLRYRALAGAALFVIPSTLLGMVSPFAARLKMNALAHSGRTVGGLYALSTLGSIAGTFAAGFWLIPAAGSTRLLFILALVLLLSSLLAAPRAILYRKAAVLALCAAAAYLSMNTPPVLAAGKLVLDLDTAYQRLLVFDLPIENRLPARVLSMGFEEYHSAMLLDAPDELPLDYTRFFRLAPALHPNLRRVLVIGGGALSYPRDLLHQSPSTQIEVVELDPAVTQVARDYFGFRDDSRIAIHHEDGRTFLNRDGPTYDAVILDVFWGRTVPFHLATLESARRIAARLSPGGMLLINFMSAIEGQGGDLFRAEYATLRRVFPQVLVFPVHAPNDARKVQNLVLLAVRTSSPIQAPQGSALRYWNHRWRGPIQSGLPELTDDLAPVELYASRQAAAPAVH